MRPGSFRTPRYEQDRPGTSLFWAGVGNGQDDDSLDIHAHPGAEIGIVLNGRHEIHYSGLAAGYEAGEVWLCGVWEPHGWRVASAGVLSIAVVFSPEFIGEEMIGDMPWPTLFSVPPDQRPRASSPGLRKRVLEIGHSLHREVVAKRPYWEDVVRHELLHLMVELSRNWQEMATLRASGDVGVDSLSRIMPALNLIHSRPRRRIGLDEVAAACDLSPSRFHLLFKRVIGTSFRTFCLRTRLSFAAQQMLNTDRTTAAIAADAGFVDASHLHRQFVKQFACTPAEYREHRKAAHRVRSSEEREELV